MKSEGFKITQLLCFLAYQFANLKFSFYSHPLLSKGISLLEFEELQASRCYVKQVRRYYHSLSSLGCKKFSVRSKASYGPVSL